MCAVYYLHHCKSNDIIPGVDDSHYCINEIIRPALLCQVPDHIKGVRNLFVNTMDSAILLVIVNLTKVYMYQSVFTRCDHYLEEEHVLEHITHTLCSYPLE